APFAPSVTAFGSTCDVPGVVTHTGTPFAAHCATPVLSTRRANTSKSPPRSSHQTAIAPPRPSGTARVMRELNAVVHSGTFTVGSSGHAARACGAHTIDHAPSAGTSHARKDARVREGVCNRTCQGREREKRAVGESRGRPCTKEHI